MNAFGRHLYHDAYILKYCVIMLPTLLAYQITIRKRYRSYFYLARFFREWSESLWGLPLILSIITKIHLFQVFGIYFS